MEHSQEHQVIFPSLMNVPQEDDCQVAQHIPVEFAGGPFYFWHHQSAWLAAKHSCVEINFDDISLLVFANCLTQHEHYQISYLMLGYEPDHDC